MFEGTLVESRGLVGSPAVRWTAAGSITLQCAVLALLVVHPLFRPDAMKLAIRAPELFVPPLPKPVPPVPRVKVAPEQLTATAAVTAPSARAEAVHDMLRRFVPGSTEVEDPARFGPGTSMAMGGPVGPPELGTPANGSGAAVMRAASKGLLRVSSGVSAGMLLSSIQPVYPPIAKAAHIQGTVVLEAVISKAGRVESLRAVSGPEMLRQSALDAVRGARYSPYRLNGELVEVQTTIQVNFRLGS